MFKFHLITDTDTDSYSGVLEAKQQITSNKFYKLMESDSYGCSVNGIAIILMCREPDITFKQRLRFSKKEKLLYMDIMLDFNKFSIMSNEQRILEICKTLLEQIPPIIKKYKFKDFNLDMFMEKLRGWFELNGYI